MSFNNVLDEHRKLASSETDKGTRFEYLMRGYLQTDPTYANKFKEVWLWNEFPSRRDFGGKDTGIDLVALTNEGDYWAIQCKCFQASSTIDKPAVDSFLATSSREFMDSQYKTAKFSHRLWISTTNHWGDNAEKAIQNQNPPVSRINLSDLQQARVDWRMLDDEIFGEAARDKKKELYPHQVEALDKTHEYFKTADRGKLIMACGTGKTLTTLRIAEHETAGKGFILFLVPSIALLGQTLREWSADAREPLNAVCICSDAKVSSKKSDNDEDSNLSSPVDLALPASTNVQNILSQFQQIEETGHDRMTVVFSTYQSIKVISDAQKALQKQNQEASVFDLIICDEAHRTTGVTLSGDDESAFVQVHDNDFLQAKKRIYMTATPRLYSDDSKSRAALNDAVLCSMDDENLYGQEIYRIGFGEAVERNLLTDYKVLILTLSDKDVSPAIQAMIADESKEISADDASKLIGCINALSKQILGDAGILKGSDPDPMKKAVAFCQNIKTSKKITNIFNKTTDTYINAFPKEKQDKMISVDSKHVDGTMSAPERDELLSWLKEESDECRVLSNVRCLSEGVDVPSLDAVMFLSARNSQVDVVQSVGRVMRRAPGKNYGYIIIPVVVPSDVEADKALDNNEKYKVVWTVLNALRAHDDRFNATVNQIELNKKKPDNILIGRPDYTFDEAGKPTALNEASSEFDGKIQEKLQLQFEELQNVVFARMVEKVGDRLYWEQWAKSVAEIAEKQIKRISGLVEKDGEHKKAFAEFLKELQKNINPSITNQQAIEMLSQHIVTKPVFEALFAGYSFVQNNPISKSMQEMLSILEAQTIEKDTEILDKFYDSVRKRAEGIDNAEGKQRIIIELYDKFFKTAFPKMAEQLGIVYTPVEVVDFIIHSVDDVLKKEFGRGISDENVHILDPFTGTGTFITRLLQSKLIKPEDLQRKYSSELFANEIVLLAYYIAAVNIENAYHDLIASDTDYNEFNGICLTDTFQLGETKDNSDFLFKIFPQNSERVKAQQKAPLRVIMGNPPYSVGQKSANDNAQNQAYPKLDNRIADTYAKGTNAINKNSLYDAYIKAFRWSSDRLDKEHGGIICFVSNGSWIDGNSQDGFRKHLEKEFSNIYVFNLRGNARTQGELRRKEAGNVFGSGSRTPISVTLLVKNPHAENKKATIHYHDIGDYLNREEKLDIVKKFRSIGNTEMSWKTLKPNAEGDWINQRNDAFASFIPVEPDKRGNSLFASYFVTKSRGLETSRDAIVYNSCMKLLRRNMSNMVEFFNSQVEDYKNLKIKKPDANVKQFIETDPKKISWSSSLISHLERGNKAVFEGDKIQVANYRPFYKQFVYNGDKMIHRMGHFSNFFPLSDTNNLVICVSGVGGNKENTALVSNVIPDLHLNGDTQCFPLYYYEENNNRQPTLFDTAQESDDKYIRRDGVSDFILERARKQYGIRKADGVSKEDIFYYVYGILHSPEYRNTFTNDLKKMLPRIPLVEDVRDFWAFSKAGRNLADLHINYESVPPCAGVEVVGAEKANYHVTKMRFPKKDQKDTIIYNSNLTITHIPAQAYEYVVNGKSAIEWIMERYQIKTDKNSGITNDPNDWAKEVAKPSYILDLLLSIINLSVQTVDLVNKLPKLEFE